MKTSLERLFACCALIALALVPTIHADEQTPPAKDAAPAESKALTFPFSYTGEGLGNLRGGYKRGAIYEGLLSVGVQGDLEKLAGWKGASFLVSGIYPHGSSLSQNYVHDLNLVSNIDAYDSIRLYEAWVQQEFADGKWSLRLGQILADTEFFVSGNSELFINGAFGTIPVVGLNFHVAAYPLATPGMRVRWSPNDSFSVQAAVFDGDAGDAGVDNKHGLDWDISAREGVLAITEAAYKVNSGKDDKGLRGTYKLGVFYHTSSSGATVPSQERHTNGGGYFIADQQLWRKPGSEEGGLSGVFRIGGAPEDRNLVRYCFDTGLNYTGIFSGREKDIAGVGFSYTNLSESLGTPTETRHEAALEATYKAKLKDWLTVQPDCQCIFNPGAVHKASNALVAGVQVVVSF